MADMEASCVFHVEVRTRDQLEQSKISIWTVTKMRIVMLTVQHDLNVSICVTEYPRDYWRQPSRHVLSPDELSRISDNQLILAVVHLYLPLWTYKQHWTDLLQIAGQWDTHATCSHTQQDSSWVEPASWLLLIPFWLEADCIFPRTSHFFLFSLSSPIPHQQNMATTTRQPGERGPEPSRLMGASSHVSLAGTHQQCRQEIVHHDAA